MPTETPYIKSLSSDFPSASVNVAKLQFEIQAAASGITVQLKDITRNGDQVTITFKDELPPAEETALDTVIAAHDYTASPPILDTQIINDPTVHVRKPSEGINRVWAISHNWCDKTTWFQRSVYVEDEAVGIGDGAQTVFSLANDFVIDMTHGKVADEDLIVPHSSASWDPIVKIDGLIQVGRVPFASSGGDYTIDYVAGEITFASAPGVGQQVLATYYYSPNTPGSSIIEYSPPVGKKWLIDIAEVQFSKNIIMSDTVVWEVLAGGMPVAAPTIYKSFGNYLDTSYGSYPIIPALGGPDRGLLEDTVVLRWEYVSSIVLLSSLGLTARVCLQNDIPYGGERATFTLYAAEENE